MMDYVVKEIERLSQNEGLNDDEISTVLGCSRATVNRARLKHGIPRANLKNRKDKKLKCYECNKEFLVKRDSPNFAICSECCELQG